MASLTPKTLFVGATANANVYTANSTAGSYTIVKNFNFCNPASANKTLSIHILAPAASATSNNIYLSNTTLLANESINIDVSLVLSNGYSIYFAHDGNVAAVITGVEYA